MNSIYLQVNCEPQASRTNSQLSLATSPDILQTSPSTTSPPSQQHQQQQHQQQHFIGGHFHPHPPARPRKPPRLLHYANMTFQSTMASMNRSRSCSPEKPIRILGYFLVIFLKKNFMRQSLIAICSMWNTQF